MLRICYHLFDRYWAHQTITLSQYADIIDLTYILAHTVQLNIYFSGSPLVKLQLACLFISDLFALGMLKISAEMVIFGNFFYLERYEDTRIILY